jgi:hypothetical protein
MNYYLDTSSQNIKLHISADYADPTRLEPQRLTCETIIMLITNGLKTNHTLILSSVCLMRCIDMICPECSNYISAIIPPTQCPSCGCHLEESFEDDDD